MEDDIRLSASSGKKRIVIAHGPTLAEMSRLLQPVRDHRFGLKRCLGR
jgi:hypothetical protein